MAEPTAHLRDETPRTYPLTAHKPVPCDAVEQIAEKL